MQNHKIFILNNEVFVVDLHHQLKKIQTGNALLFWKYNIKYGICNHFFQKKEIHGG